MTYNEEVTKDSAPEFLLAHPCYPPLKSVCKWLKKWNIDHYPLKLSKEEILDLKPPYIAHMGGARGQLALVEKTDDSKVTFTVNKRKKTVQSKEEFSQKLSVVVIVMEPNLHSGEANCKENRQNELVKTFLLPSIVTAIFLFGLYTLYKQTSWIMTGKFKPSKPHYQLLLFCLQKLGKNHYTLIGKVLQK